MSVAAQVDAVLTAAWDRAGQHRFELSAGGLAWHLIQAGLIDPDAPLGEAAEAVAEWRFAR